MWEKEEKGEKVQRRTPGAQFWFFSFKCQELASVHRAFLLLATRF